MYTNGTNDSLPTQHGPNPVLDGPYGSRGSVKARHEIRHITQCAEMYAE